MCCRSLQRRFRGCAAEQFTPVCRRGVPRGPQRARAAEDLVEGRRVGPLHPRREPAVTEA